MLGRLTINSKIKCMPYVSKQALKLLFIFQLTVTIFNTFAIVFMINTKN